MPSSIHSIVFDCEQPSRLAHFWAAALSGYHVRPYDNAEIERLHSLGIDVADDPTVVLDPDQPGLPTVFFAKVPEAKLTKNRVHLDLRPDSSMEAEVSRLTAIGAHPQATVEHEYAHWIVLTYKRLCAAATLGHNM